MDRLRISFVLGYYTGDFQYDDIIRKMTIIENDIKTLNTFKRNVLEKRIDGYGYEILEPKKLRSETETN